mmetsp:Transcript_1984/g.4773  ORF Transcript_1984/g.4773 Transcript_1984/m.4773 type:complete len:353 (+) Transcript_1984:64-1122(+)
MLPQTNLWALSGKISGIPTHLDWVLVIAMLTTSLLLFSAPLTAVYVGKLKSLFGHGARRNMQCVPGQVPTHAKGPDCKVIASERKAFDAGLPLTEILVPVCKCGDIAISGEAQQKFLRAYNTYGLCVLSCDTSETCDLRELKDLFGSIVPHEFADSDGRVFLDPQAERASNNVRDTEAEHQVHTDETYTDAFGKIITLQCDIAASEGGESVVISGKMMHDMAQQRLTECEMAALRAPCLSVGRALPGSKIHCCTFPIFGSSGSHVQVRYRSQDPYVSSTTQEASPGYRFCEDFVKTEDYRLTVKLQPGQVLVMDNTAVLHGRLPFPPQQRRRFIRINYFNDGTLSSQLNSGF